MYSNSEVKHNLFINYYVLIIKMQEYIKHISSYQVKYKKDSIIKNAHDICNYIGYVVSGFIKIVNYFLDGKETIIKTIGPNNFFGNFLIYGSNNHYPGYIIASTDATIIYIKQDTFETELCKNQDLLHYYLKYISTQVIEMQQTIKISNQPSLKEKIYALILYKCQINNSNYFKYKSQNELAQLINVPRSSFARTLKILENEKLIKKGNKIIKIIQN